MSADERVLPERWPECEGPACGYRHDPNLPCFTDATDHDSVPGSTDTAGDPSAFLPDDLVATARRIGCTLAEQLADEVERLRAAQINRPAPDPDALTDLIARLLDEPRCEIDHRYGEHAEGVACAERDAMTLLGRIPPPGSGCA